MIIELLILVYLSIGVLIGTVMMTGIVLLKMSPRLNPGDGSCEQVLARPVEAFAICILLWPDFVRSQWRRRGSR